MLSPFFRFAAEEGCVQGKECQLLRKAFISKIKKRRKGKEKKKKGIHNNKSETKQ